MTKKSGFFASSLIVCLTAPWNWIQCIFGKTLASVFWLKQRELITVPSWLLQFDSGESRPERSACECTFLGKPYQMTRRLKNYSNRKVKRLTNGRCIFLGTVNQFRSSIVPKRWTSRINWGNPYREQIYDTLHSLSFNSFAEPKSQIFKIPYSGSTSKFCGLMSRWQMRWQCIYAKPRSNWNMYNWNDMASTKRKTRNQLWYRTLRPDCSSYSLEQASLA